jgi:hypothetical protein
VCEATAGGWADDLPVRIPLGIALALVSPRWIWFGLALLIPFAALVYFAFLHGWWLNLTLPAGTLTPT